jgi:hypothetical protein
MRQLARDNGIGKSTAYDYLHEGIEVLAARAPNLHGALLRLPRPRYATNTALGGRPETPARSIVDRCDDAESCSHSLDLWRCSP